MEDFITEESLTQGSRDKSVRARHLAGQWNESQDYEPDDSFYPVDTTLLENFKSVHTTQEMLNFLEAHPKVELDAKVLGFCKEGKKIRSIPKAQFLEAFKHNDSAKMKEALDAFSLDDIDVFSNQLVGQDFVPILGGPFFKNLYYWQDYIRMHAQCFYAYHHDPIARAIVHITRDFVLGGGFKIVCDTKDPMGKKAMATWEAFETANNIQEQINHVTLESSIYGEVMIWKLPNNQTKITYRLAPDDKIPTGLIPRVRLIDPSNIVEVITYPEDITRALTYVWLTPTQYQTYTGSGQEGKPSQPVMKFIYRQIPAEQMLHFKINSVSNEKRGRSDLFPVLGYLKRLRDSVNYQIISLQKQAAWSIDTTIEGAQSDIDAYVQDQQSIGTIAPVGSEFVHTGKIKREYLAPATSGRGGSVAFEWAISMISAGVQIPTSYFGTHLSGGQTRASALVATEPVAKKFQMRQNFIRGIVLELWKYAQEQAGNPVPDCDVLFPEVIEQDRSTKLKDLALAQMQGWIKPQRAAETAAKEFDFQDYHWDEESEEIQKAKAQMPPGMASPLTAPPTAGLKPVPPNGIGPTQPETPAKPSAVTGPEREKLKKHYGQL